MAFRSEDAGGSIKGWELGHWFRRRRISFGLVCLSNLARFFFPFLGVVVVVLKSRSHCIFHIPLSFFSTSRKSMHRCTSSTYPYDQHPLLFLFSFPCIRNSFSRLASYTSKYLSPYHFPFCSSSLSAHHAFVFAPLPPLSPRPPKSSSSPRSESPTAQLSLSYGNVMTMRALVSPRSRVR